LRNVHLKGTSTATAAPRPRAAWYAQAADAGTQPGTKCASGSNAGVGRGWGYGQSVEGWLQTSFDEKTGWKRQGAPTSAGGAEVPKGAQASSHTRYCGGGAGFAGSVYNEQPEQQPAEQRATQADAAKAPNTTARRLARQTLKRKVAARRSHHGTPSRWSTTKSKPLHSEPANVTIAAVEIAELLAEGNMGEVDSMAHAVEKAAMMARCKSLEARAAQAERMADVKVREKEKLQAMHVNMVLAHMEEKEQYEATIESLQLAIKKLQRPWYER